MNIDMTLDYDKLLEEAKARYAKVLELSDRLRPAFMCGDAATLDPIRKEYDKAWKGWEQWCKKNIRNRRLKLEKDFVNKDVPIGISAVLSGRDFWTSDLLR